MKMSIKNETNIVNIKNEEYNIQKLIKLLNNHSLKSFKIYLKFIKADLPLKFIELLTTNLLTYQSPATLCKTLYGRNDRKTYQSYNQLASYTFKLTSFLSRNYPSYLIHNIYRIQKLINENKTGEADYLSKILLDMSIKIEDFQTQICLLKMLVQISFVQKSFSKMNLYQEKLTTAINNEQTLLNINNYLHNNFNASVNNQYVLSTIDKHIDFFNKFINNKCYSIKFISRYAMIYINFFYNYSEILKEENISKHFELEDEYDKYSYIILPFLTDIKVNLIYFRLNVADINLKNPEVKKALKMLSHLGKTEPYWKSFNCLPEFYYLNIKSTYYLTRYISQRHKKNYEKTLTIDVKKDIEDIIYRLEKLIDIFDNSDDIKLIAVLGNLRFIYAAILLVSEKDNLEKSISIFEDLLNKYKSYSLFGSINSIFTCLIIAHFLAKNYNKCLKLYLKYQKNKADRAMIDENDTLITIYYYLSRWNISPKKQFINKLEEIPDIIKDKPFYKNMNEFIIDIAKNYNIPFANS